MIYKTNQLNYNGIMLKQKFGYDFYQENYNPNGVIVISYGVLSIEYDNTHFLNEYPIFEDAIHLCWEIPNLNLKGNYFLKQIFITKIYEELKKIKPDINLDENYNIIYKNLESDTESLISFNLNKQIDNNICLGYLGLNNNILNLIEQDKYVFSEKVEKIFYDLLKGSFIDTIKTT